MTVAGTINLQIPTYISNSLKQNHTNVAYSVVENYSTLLLLLTLSVLIPLRIYTLPYWSNPPFLIFHIRVLWHIGLSARARELHGDGDDGTTAVTAVLPWLWG